MGKRVASIKRLLSREYNSWKAMLARCYTPSNPSYKYCGGRGITVCKRWRNEEGFANFIRDMGGRPKGMTLDRRDNDGHYTPENCRWATPQEQARNRSTYNRNITWNGETKCVKAWASQVGISPTTITCRLSQGWTIEEALTIPAKMGNVFARIPYSPKSPPVGASENSSGFYGVYWHKRMGKWIARLHHDRKTHHIGYFLDRDEAVAAVKQKYQEFFGAKAHA